MDNHTPDVRELARRAQQIAHQLARARQDLAGLERTGSAGGGYVTVSMRGDGEVTKLVIDQAAVDDGDAAALSALVLAALRQASDALKAEAAERMNAATDGQPGLLGVPQPDPALAPSRPARTR
ncbi:MAG TPA: YbaB/EbfC family nucleoid-associated protein [Rugosimonospora sp.]|nr:YbaB/EbfC family nucleoid-associated protein [Rugosimonospora sp.]